MRRGREGGFPSPASQPCLRDALSRPAASRLDPAFDRAPPAAANEEDILTQLLALHHGEPVARKLADDLLRLFGTLDGVLHATPAELRLVPGMTDRTARVISYQRRLADILSRRRRSAQRSFSRLSATIAYLAPRLAELSIETVQVLYLNPRNRLIAEEELSRGTVNHVTLYPRELVRRALLRSATAVILAHNHPSGDPSPSADDIAMTAQVEAALRAVDIALHDHLVIAARGVFSFRSNGLLPHCPEGWDHGAPLPRAADGAFQRPAR